MNAEAENCVSDMVRDKAFCDFITKKTEEKVHVTGLQAERDKLRDRLRQAEGSGRKLIGQTDRPDDVDRHCNRKYRDMQDRFDNLCDRRDEPEDATANVTGKMNGAYGNINAETLCKIQLRYDKIYETFVRCREEAILPEFRQDHRNRPQPRIKEQSSETH